MKLQIIIKTMEQKTCNHCKQKLSLDNFGVNKKEKDGHARRCKSCHNQINKIWSHLHPEVFRRGSKKYYVNNPLKQKLRHKKYYEENKEVIKIKRKIYLDNKKRLNNPIANAFVSPHNAS